MPQYTACALFHFSTIINYRDVPLARHLAQRNRQRDAMYGSRNRRYPHRKARQEQVGWATGSAEETQYAGRYCLNSKSLQAKANRLNPEILLLCFTLLPS